MLQPSQALLLAWVEHMMDEEVPVQPSAHDPAEKARERASEQEELRRREEEVVSRLCSEALQLVMGGVAESWIDEYTGEAIREKARRCAMGVGGGGGGCGCAPRDYA